MHRADLLLFFFQVFHTLHPLRINGATSFYYIGMSWVLNAFWFQHQFLQSQQSIMGNKRTGCHVGWTLPLFMYMTCHHLQSVAQCTTCSHDLVIWQWEWPAPLKQPQSHTWLFLTMDNNGFGMYSKIMFKAQKGGKKNKTHAHILCLWFNFPPPHSKLIYYWVDVALNGRGLVYSKWGFALQNALITPIIFDITVNHDLRLL